MHQKLEVESVVGTTSGKASWTSRFGRKPRNKELVQKRNELMLVQMNAQTQVAELEKQISQLTEQIERKKEYNMHLRASVKEQEAKFASMPSTETSQVSNAVVCMFISVAVWRQSLQSKVTELVAN